MGTIIVLMIGMLTPLQAALSPMVVVTTVGFSGGIGLFFGVIPARRAAKLDPIIALRSSF